MTILRGPEEGNLIWRRNIRTFMYDFGNSLSKCIIQNQTVENSEIRTKIRILEILSMPKISTAKSLRKHMQQAKSMNIRTFYWTNIRI